MNILLTHPNKHNRGDLVIQRGCETLIAEAFPDATLSYFAIHNFMFNRPTGSYLATPDLIIHAGTPFFWDGMTTSPKYSNMMGLCTRFPRVPKILMGIGAGFPFDLINDSMAIRSTFFSARELFDQCTVIGRDPIIGQFSQDLLPCPAFFAPVVDDFPKIVETDRVHVAIPAWCAGSDVTLKWLDSRALTFYWGIEQDMAAARAEYIKILRGAIREPATARS